MYVVSQSRHFLVQNKFTTELKGNGNELVYNYIVLTPYKQVAARDWLLWAFSLHYTKRNYKIQASSTD